MAVTFIPSGVFCSLNHGLSEMTNFITFPTLHKINLQFFSRNIYTFHTLNLHLRNTSLSLRLIPFFKDVLLTRYVQYVQGHVCKIISLTNLSTCLHNDTCETVVNGRKNSKKTLRLLIPYLLLAKMPYVLICCCGQIAY
jgi:hypothetical protein